MVQSGPVCAYSLWRWMGLFRVLTILRIAPILHSRWTGLFITGARNLVFHHGSNIQTFNIFSDPPTNEIVSDNGRYDVLKPSERK